MTDGEPETVVSASLQKINSIKNPIKQNKTKFYFIKSETSDSFVNHFDGHFAYLKTLDFYFKHHVYLHPQTPFCADIVPTTHVLALLNCNRFKRGSLPEKSGHPCMWYVDLSAALCTKQTKMPSLSTLFYLSRPQT